MSFSDETQWISATKGVNLTGALLSAILFYDLFQRTKHFIGNRVDTRPGWVQELKAFCYGKELPCTRWNSDKQPIDA